MLRVRVIPCLLLLAEALVKTVRFKAPKYIGDPVNAVRIFNEKEVDELVFLDISATREGRGPNYSLIKSIASEAFMPLGYGGGISTVQQVGKLFSIGIEKVVINSAALTDLGLIAQAAKIGGSQSVMVSLDVKRNIFGKYRVHTNGGRKNSGVDPVDFVRRCEDAGAGEVLLTAIDRDGMQSGYDLDLIARVASAVSIPVIAAGGAGSLDDLRRAADKGASAVAAGSLFVFHGRHRAVLITYPEYRQLQALFADG